MTGDAEVQIARYLDAGESLRWSGRPRQGFLFRQLDWFLVPFSILWAGFAVFWETFVIASGAPFFFILWGIPFTAVGIYIVAGRFEIDRRTRAHTYYGLTDHRAMIVSGVARPTVRSIELRSLGEVVLNDRADGSGTIVLGRNMWFGAMPGGWPMADRYQAPQFERIPDARSVYNMIRERQKAPV
jgi:hypothetical protein